MNIGIIVTAKNAISGMMCRASVNLSYNNFESNRDVIEFIKSNKMRK